MIEECVPNSLKHSNLKSQTSTDFAALAAFWRKYEKIIIILMKIMILCYLSESSVFLKDLRRILLLIFWADNVDSKNEHLEMKKWALFLWKLAHFLGLFLLFITVKICATFGKRKSKKLAQLFRIFFFFFYIADGIGLLLEVDLAALANFQQQSFFSCCFFS